MAEKILFIIRGLPGSGKNTLGNRLAELVHSADQFFESRDGNGGMVYNFDPKRIHIAHKFCRHCVELALKSRVEKVAVANTFTRKWELQDYLDLAEENGYLAQVIHVETTLTDEELAARNIHGVGADIIKKMRERWETL